MIAALFSLRFWLGCAVTETKVFASVLTTRIAVIVCDVGRRVVVADNIA